MGDARRTRLKSRGAVGDSRGNDKSAGSSRINSMDTQEASRVARGLGILLILVQRTTGLSNVGSTVCAGCGT